MSYSYSTPFTNGQMVQPQYYDVSQQAYQKPSSLSAGIAGAAVGGLTGGIIGGVVNPYFAKNGEVKDTFSHKAFKNYLKAKPEAGKDLYEQGQKVLKEIKNAKSVDEVKTLITNNAKIKEIISNDLIQGMTDANLSSNKNSIVQTINAKMNENIQNMKNNIQRCWNREAKKWEKPAGMEDVIYNSINKAKRWLTSENIFKGVGIGVLAGGITAFVAHKLYTYKKESAQQ